MLRNMGTGPRPSDVTSLSLKLSEQTQFYIPPLCDIIQKIPKWNSQHTGQSHGSPHIDCRIPPFWPSLSGSKGLGLGRGEKWHLLDWDAVSSCFFPSIFLMSSILPQFLSFTHTSHLEILNGKTSCIQAMRNHGGHSGRLTLLSFRSWDCLTVSKMAFLQTSTTLAKTERAGKMAKR